MANVFISHSGADVGWAEEIHQWLSQDGHKVFLDRDHQDGIAAGDDWESRLYERLRWADAVVCVVTPSYLQSVWCAGEIGAARALGSELLPVRASADPVQHRLLKVNQYVDVTRDASGARERLRLRLSVIDGGGGRGWPDDQSPYPGLRAFELGEHRVFFGRGHEIKQLAERLRSPAERAARAILTVVGPSGCGKSSLIRAGLLPRIADEDDWLPVPPILPGTDPIGGLARALAAVTRDRHMGFDTTSLRRDLGRDGLQSVATDILLAAGVDSRCKLLVTVDQFEELLTQTDQRDRAELVAMLQPALGGPIQVIATMRPEFLDPLAKDPELSKLALRMHQVRALESDALRSVIEDPATVAGLTFEEDLVSRLVADTGGGDALPLLAFTLEQLAHDVQRGGQLTHQRYSDIGGVQGALQRQADAALEEACSNTGVTRDQVISELLDLVTIDNHGRPTKRRAVLDEFSGIVVEQLAPFVDRRLLSTEAEGERTLIAVAHEAFLVNWTPLKDEIDAQAAALRARRVVESAATEWAAGGRDDGALLQGKQLAKATFDIGAELEPVARTDAKASSDGKQRFALPKWWPGDRRLVTRVDLNEVGRSFLEASIRTDRSRRRLRLIEVMGVIVVLAATAVTAGVGFIRARDANEQAHQRLQESTALRLVSEGRAMLGNVHEGSDARAITEILAARTIAAKPDEGAVLTALQATSNQLKIIDTDASVDKIATATDGRRIIAAEGGTATFRDANTGLVTATFPGFAFSADGSRVVSADDTSLQVRDTQTGRPLGRAIAPNKDGGALMQLAFSPDSRKIVFAQYPSFLYLWEVERGTLIPMTGSPEAIAAVIFTPDGRRVVTSGFDGVIRVWSAESGLQLSQPISMKNDIAYTLALSRDGRHLFTAGTADTVRMWDLDTGQPLGDPIPDQEDTSGYVQSIALSHDGHRIVSGSTDDTIRLWDAETATPIGKPMAGHGDDVNAVAFSADDQQVISGSADKTIRIWDAHPSDELGKPIDGHGSGVAGVVISHDGRRIVWHDYSTINVWDAQTLTPVLPPLVARADNFALSRDGSRIASLDASTVSIWDANTGARLREWDTGQELEQPFGWIAFSPDAQRIATFGGTVDNPGLHQTSDMSIAVWDANSGKEIGVTDHMTYVSSAVFSPDSRYLAYNKDQGLRIVDLASGQTVQELPFLHVWSLAYNADGKQILTAGDKTIRLLDAGSGKPLAEMTDTRGSIHAAIFSADDKYIISDSGANIRIWDAGSHQAIGDLTGAEGEISNLTITDDNRQIVADDLGRGGLWPGPAAWPDLLCVKLTQNMSDKQWNEWVEPTIPYKVACPDLPKALDQSQPAG